MTVAFSPRDGDRRVTLALSRSAAMPSTDRELPAPAPRAAEALPCHDARRLTAGQGTATILLDGQPYVLRITRAGKLILTK
jgi:hemin uptake protein HemP